MKKLAVILLTSIYLFGATGASQLFKLPVLIQHYVEHKAENPAISIVDFFKIHYTDPFVMDEDFQRDMQLPFKTLDNSSFLALSNILSDKLYIEHRPGIMPARNFVLRNVQLVPSFDAKDFFQPPRTA